MAYIIVGLGNPGEEYKNTRHNTGQIIIDLLKDDEMKEIKKMGKVVAELVPVLVKEGREKAMSIYNAG